MPLAVLNPDVIRRLRSRLRLFPIGANRSLEVPDILVPVVEVGRILTDTEFKVNAETSSTSARVVFFTVPENELWTMFAYNAFLSGGDRTSTLWGVGSSAGADFITLETYSATNNPAGTLATPIPVGPGTTIEMLFGAGSSDGAWTFRLLVMKEQLAVRP